jgi:hypothetical protein
MAAFTACALLMVAPARAQSATTETVPTHPVLTDRFMFSLASASQWLTLAPVREPHKPCYGK